MLLDDVSAAVRLRGFSRHGHSVEELLAGHPRLTREGIEAALQYAIDALRAERVVSAAG